MVIQCSDVESELQRLENLLKANRADGDACLVCQFGLAIIEENIGQNAEFWEDFLARLCELLPTVLERQACQVAVNNFGVEVILKLLETYNPDYVCGPNVANVCQQCTVDYVEEKTRFEETALNIRSRIVANILTQELKGGRDVPPEMLPEVDNDGDNFSPVDNLRRTAKWRGKDWFVDTLCGI